MVFVFGGVRVVAFCIFPVGRKGGSGVGAFASHAAPSAGAGARSRCIHTHSYTQAGCCEWNFRAAPFSIPMLRFPRCVAGIQLTSQASLYPRRHEKRGARALSAPAPTTQRRVCMCVLPEVEPPKKRFFICTFARICFPLR